jgi:hypothetical protein
VSGEAVRVPLSSASWVVDHGWKGASWAVRRFFVHASVREVCEVEIGDQFLVTNSFEFFYREWDKRQPFIYAMNTYLPNRYS